MQVEASEGLAQQGDSVLKHVQLRCTAYCLSLPDIPLGCWQLLPLASPCQLAATTDSSLSPSLLPLSCRPPATTHGRLQDISGVFGMHSSQDYGEEYFNAEDEEAAAAWDLDELEVERLRAVASSQQQALSSGGSLGLLGLGGATPGVDGPRGEALRWLRAVDVSRLLAGRC